MALTSRISTHRGNEPFDPEDLLYTSLGVIFPDDVTCQHGEAENSLVYASPHLPRPLVLDLAKPPSEDGRLFAHYLWNASLLLAELVEGDTLLRWRQREEEGGQWRNGKEEEPVGFDVGGLSVGELGAGTALPSIMAGLVGARRVLVTDYASSAVLEALRTNTERNVRPELAPPGVVVPPPSEVLVRGHGWGGELPDDTPSHQHAYDRVFVCDCLWMPPQHGNLMRSVSMLLKRGPSARAFIVAGFHTGRAGMAGFFDAEALRCVGGLEVERIWERDCDGVERAWDPHAEEEDSTARKRWLVVAVLRRVEEER